MREEIEPLKNKLLVVEIERDDLHDKMFNNEIEIQINNKLLQLLIKKMEFQHLQISIELYSPYLYFIY